VGYKARKRSSLGLAEFTSDTKRVISHHVRTVWRAWPLQLQWFLSQGYWTYWCR